jgi:hypothetical protein
VSVLADRQAACGFRAPPRPINAYVIEHRDGLVLARSPSGAVSPAAASGADFALTIPGTSRTIPAEAPVATKA